MHSEKALFPIVVRLSGKTISFNSLQYSKADAPISFKSLGNETLFKEKHPSKAESAIFSAPLIYIVSNVEFINVFASIHVTLEGIAIVLIFEQ